MFTRITRRQASVNRQRREIRWNGGTSSFLILLGILAVTLVVTFFLYRQVQAIFKQSLQDRLQRVAATSSLLFDADLLDRIVGPESVGTADYARAVGSLQKVRATNPDIRFAYILRRTDHPGAMTFVADADSLDPSAKIDLNGDGVIDEADALVTPGDSYDVSELVIGKNYQFDRTAVDGEPSADPWGVFLSAYAPIQRGDGGADELIGIDVEISDFLRITNRALMPFLAFVLFLIVVLTAQTLSLVRVWRSRVTFLAEIDRQKDDLLSLVAHQLLTPVTAIHWYVESLQGEEEGPLTAGQKQTVETIETATRNLGNLVSMLLDASRIELGRLSPAASRFPMSDLVKELLVSIEPRAKAKGIELRLKMPRTDDEVTLDRRLTQIILDNLLSNAVKYTPTGGKVEIGIDIGDSKARLTVRDTGCGIPQAEQAKIFGKLYRATNVAEMDGNGFGLYVTKGAVEAQGGSINFESTQGSGTTFTVELPRHLATSKPSHVRA